MNVIRKLRTEKGLTQEELGNILNVKKAAVSKYELGRAQPSPDILKKLSDFFGVSIDHLLNNDTLPSDTSPKQPKDLVKFLDQAEVMFDGDTYKLNDDDRKKIRAALELAFWDAKERNKRKKQ